MHSKTRRVFALAALAAGLVAAAAWADKAPPESEKKEAEKPNPKGDMVDKLATAYNLVKIGREMKSAEALVVAARILAETPASEKADTKVKLAENNPKPPDGAKKEEVSPDALLTEAGKLSDRPYTAELIKDARQILAERKRGEIDGPAVHNGYVGPYSTQTWTAVFVQGDRAVVTVASTGGRLDVAIYDGLGGSAYCNGQANSTISWYPRETKTYTIKVQNNSGQGVAYRLINN
jgi:hypothetical protein